MTCRDLKHHWVICVSLFLIDILIFHRRTTSCTMGPVLWSNINLPCVLLSVFTIHNNSNHTEWCHNVLYQLGKSYFFSTYQLRVPELGQNCMMPSIWAEDENCGPADRSAQPRAFEETLADVNTALCNIPTTSFTHWNQWAHICYCNSNPRQMDIKSRMRVEENPHREECWRLTQVQKCVIRNRS